MKIFKERTAEYHDHVESFLRDWYAQWNSEPQTRLFDSITYSLQAGGKRLRPIFAFEFCRFCCGDWKKATPLAAAVEMIHTYSLIHDDLPSMDNDDFRRGKPTNHRVFGEAMAILAGDGLLSDAFYVASTAQLSGSNMADAIGILAACAGSTGMVGGQVLDILSEERTLTEQEVLDIQSRKTGALIRSACCLGALAGGATEAQFDAACIFAANLGLAFQIRDDMLDVIGNAQELGKATCADGNKNTFVRLYGLERCDELVKTYTQNALDALSIFDDTAYLRQLAEDLTMRKY